MRSNISLLQKERVHVLNEYTSAKGHERVRLLVRIMDIDEQLDITKRKDTRSTQKVG